MVLGELARLLRERPPFSPAVGRALHAVRVVGHEDLCPVTRWPELGGALAASLDKAVAAGKFAEGATKAAAERARMEESSLQLARFHAADYWRLMVLTMDGVADELQFLPLTPEAARAVSTYLTHWREPVFHARRVREMDMAAAAKVSGRPAPGAAQDAQPDSKLRLSAAVRADRAATAAEAERAKQTAKGPAPRLLEGRGVTAAGEQADDEGEGDEDDEFALDLGGAYGPDAEAAAAAAARACPRSVDADGRVRVGGFAVAHGRERAVLDAIREDEEGDAVKGVSLVLPVYQAKAWVPPFECVHCALAALGNAVAAAPGNITIMTAATSTESMERYWTALSELDAHHAQAGTCTRPRGARVRLVGPDGDLFPRVRWSSDARVPLYPLFKPALALPEPGARDDEDELWSDEEPAKLGPGAGVTSLPPLLRPYPLGPSAAVPPPLVGPTPANPLASVAPLDAAFLQAAIRAADSHTAAQPPLTPTTAADAASSSAAVGSQSLLLQRFGKFMRPPVVAQADGTVPEHMRVVAAQQALERAEESAVKAVLLRKQRELQLAERVRAAMTAGTEQSAIDEAVSKALDRLELAMGDADGEVLRLKGEVKSARATGSVPLLVGKPPTAKPAMSPLAKMREQTKVDIAARRELLRADTAAAAAGSTGAAEPGKGLFAAITGHNKLLRKSNASKNKDGDDKSQSKGKRRL